MKSNDYAKPIYKMVKVKKNLKRDKMIELRNHSKLVSSDGVEWKIESAVHSSGKKPGKNSRPGKNKESVLVIRDYSERKRKDKAIKFLSFHDQLTGLYNRRFFEEELKRLDKERNIPIALVMADINGLKLTNDAYGCRAGDELIRRISAILCRECRADDIVARIGSDEFAVILPKTNPDQARRFAARIYESMAYEKPDKVVLSLALGFAVKQDDSDKIEDVLRRAEDDMYRQKLTENSSVKSRTIVLILNALYERDAREMSHSKRVGKLCEELASEMHFDKQEASQMRTAGMLHDIGKIRIDEDILKKPENLTESEWQEVMKHPETGYRILSSVNGFSEIAIYIKQHQERWDGKGYPDALKGEEISLQARIIAVAAAYDAMTSDKPYGAAMSQERAIEEIRKYAGLQFDPEVAKTLIEKVIGKDQKGNQQ